MIQDADSGDGLSNGGSRLWAISLGTFFLALKRKFADCRTEPAKLKCYKISHSALSSKILSTSKPTPAGRAPPGALLFLLAQTE
jgi:hypothetical protein